MNKFMKNHILKNCIMKNYTKNHILKNHMIKTHTIKNYSTKTHKMKKHKTEYHFMSLVSSLLNSPDQAASPSFTHCSRALYLIVEHNEQSHYKDSCDTITLQEESNHFCKSFDFVVLHRRHLPLPPIT